MDQDLVMWNAIVAAVMPAIVALVQQPNWEKWLRATVTLVACLIGGLATTYFTDQWNAEDIVTSVLMVFAATLAFHASFFKPTGISDAIEGRTSPHSPLAEHPSDPPPPPVAPPHDDYPTVPPQPPAP
jgi:ABC-type uncharacterized transport system permease subunit